MTPLAARFDSDSSKGVTEPERLDANTSNHPTRPDLHGNLASQLPHRQSGNQFRDFLEDTDSDFPEPGSNPEHSGQRSSAA